MILRRLYLYAVSIAALAALSFGLSALGWTILLFVFNSPDAQYSRTSLAGFTATVVVALPVWAVHQWLAHRFAVRDPAERASALRRLYLYLACGGASIGAAIALAATTASAEQQSLDGISFNQLAFVQPAWVTFVLLAVWAWHFRVATRDRAAVGEHGASATLRRWYMYVALFVGFFMMLAGAQGAIQLSWQKAVQSTTVIATPMSVFVGELVGGAFLWGVHAWIISTRHLLDDRKSTLRAVEGFIAVAICIVVALIGASAILYYAVARALGVENPGGLGDNILVGLAQPASNLIVFGVAWLSLRLRLARDAENGEAHRQAGIRRLYTNLAALVSMAVLAVGATGLLGTLLQQIEAQLIGTTASDWKDPVSLWTTLLIVGAVVWLVHWRRVPWLEERHALSRRLYLWAALLGSVLAVLGGGIAMLYVVFQQVFSTQPRLSDPANLAFAQGLAVVLVATAVGMYHWRVLRSDASTRPVTHAPSEPAAGPAIAAATAPAETGPAHEVTPGIHYALSVVGATEDDVHQALSNLPPQASYRLTPSDQPT